MKSRSLANAASGWSRQVPWPSGSAAGRVLPCGMQTWLQVAQVAGPGACALVMDEDDRLLGILTSEKLSEFVLLRQAAEGQQKAHPA